MGETGGFENRVFGCEENNRLRRVATGGVHADNRGLRGGGFL